MTRIAKIVKSNSHVDYVARVIDELDADEPPGPEDYGFAQFVAVPLAEGEEAVGVVYDTQLANPEYGSFGPRLSSRDELKVLSPDFLHEQSIGEWMELPLWLYDDAHRGMLSVDPSPAFAAGLETRPLEQTVHDTLEWVRSGEAPADPPAGLDREKEQAVLDEWLSKG